MEGESSVKTALVPAEPSTKRGRGTLPAPLASSMPAPPASITEAGSAACFAWDELFRGQLRNPHTRKAYGHAAREFLDWVHEEGVGIERVTPGMVGEYLDRRDCSAPTKKLHLSALRRLFDLLVIRHVVVLNPAASVRGERHQVIEGKTPEITIAQARKLLASIETQIAEAVVEAEKESEERNQKVPPRTAVLLRDRAIIGILIYTAARAGAVAKLKRKHFAYDGTQWTLRFDEKGGKSREIPVRHDLQGFILAYLETDALNKTGPDSPLFRTAYRRSDHLTDTAMSGIDLCRMVKRRNKTAGLPVKLSPHSFRVATVTDLLTQGIPLEEVQHLAGHADPRTTGLYDRRKKGVTRKIVDRISI
jgi:integrase/recombinase XerD